LELGGSVRPWDGVAVIVAWTVSDFRYTSHQIGAAILDGRAIPGIPRHAVRTSLRLEPGWARGMWSVLDVNHAAASFVDDTLDVRTAGWVAVDVRVGWDGRIGGWHVAPFVAIQNVFDRQYVSSVVINAARGRYYEPAPGRNAYFGLELTASRKGVEGRRYLYR
jgi:iron complex outermembrane recepter protein